MAGGGERAWMHRGLFEEIFIIPAWRMESGKTDERERTDHVI